MTENPNLSEDIQAMRLDFLKELADTPEDRLALEIFDIVCENPSNIAMGNELINKEYFTSNFDSKDKEIVDIHQSLNILYPTIFIISNINSGYTTYESFKTSNAGDTLLGGAFNGIKLLALSIKIKQDNKSVSIGTIQHYFDYFGVVNRIHIQYEIADVAQDLLIDRELFTHIVELTLNAMKYSGPKLITIGFDVVGLKMIISVENDGATITQNQIDKVFDENFTTGSQGGGNGLYYLKLYVSSKKGTVSASNITNEKGVRFEIALPLS